MSLSSVTFIFLFLPIVLLGNVVLPVKCRNFWLTLVSFIFMAWGGIEYAILLLLVILVNYVCAYIQDLQFITGRKRKVVFILGIAANLLILGYFKYFNFLIESCNSLFKTGIPTKEVLLPLGISFYVFQGISYIFDVYRKEVPAERNFISVACYIGLFIKATEGPIEKYTDFHAQAHNRKMSLDLFVHGIQRFSVGMGKKILIADTLGVLVDKIWEAMGYIGIDCPTAWLGAFAYMFQLYFDFSGYSDMAIGIGEMLGFRLKENFNYPYISKSITEFWRRWHISLSTWFKNYLYIPLGGNRRGNVYRNLFIVFLATGIWHGANTTFLAWGIWQGIFILIERKMTKENWGFRIPAAIKWAGTMFLVLFGWVIFRAPTLESAVEYFSYLFRIKEVSDIQFTFAYYMDRKIGIMLMISAVAACPFVKNCIAKKRGRAAWEMAGVLYTTAVLIWGIMAMVNSSYSPFLYFQF